MGFVRRERFAWRLRTRTLELGERTVLMGILNVTPDSFFDGGRDGSVEEAVARGLGLLEDGAEIVDVGGESTRPGAVALTSGEEQDRVLPVLEGLLRAQTRAIVSVDTYHAATARAAVRAGAEILNDVSGLMWDSEMADVLAETGVGAVLMHARGRPREWADLAGLADEQVVPMVLDGLRGSLARAHEAKIARASIVVDPGFGFGKRGRENMVLHAGLERLVELGLPVLVGTSRKRFLGGGVEATLASGVAAVLAGCHVVRVHDVAAMRRAVAVTDEILATITD